MGQCGRGARRALIPPKLADLLASFEMLDDRQDRIQALIELSDKFIPARGVTPDEAHKVRGCESEVYAWATPLEGGTWRFEFLVQNPQGLSAMAWAHVLQESLHGLTAEQIAAVPTDTVYQLFGRELSMGKSMGLMGMLQMCHTLTAHSAS